MQTITARLPSARIVMNEDGAEARRFGAFTSGTTLVYDGQGREIFRGGITDRRGGERDNPGVQWFTRVLAGGGRAAAPMVSAPVFGCPLVAEGRGVE